MKVLEEKVKFELSVAGTAELHDPIIVEFLHSDYGITVPGTTNEEVINMMIERFYGFQKGTHSHINEQIISHLKEIRKLLKQRREFKNGKDDRDTR